MFVNSATTLRISAVPSMTFDGFTVLFVTREPLALRRWCAAPASGLEGTQALLEILSMDAKD